MSDFSINGVSLAQAMGRVKAAPSDAVLRIGLFRLFTFTGQWARALTQLETAAQLDASQAMYLSAYESCLACEGVREAMVGGTTSPVFLGEPSQWQAMLLQAFRTDGETAKIPLIMEALEAAPATAGSLNGEAFDWISDVDHRFGPQLEAFIDGKYYWIGFDRLERIRFNDRTDLIDLVWLPVEFVFRGGGSKSGYLPARYPSSNQSPNEEVIRGEVTEFTDVGDQLQIAIGARQLATSDSAVPLSQITELVFHDPTVAP